MRINSFTSGPTEDDMLILIETLVAALVLCFSIEGALNISSGSNRALKYILAIPDIEVDIPTCRDVTLESGVQLFSCKTNRKIIQIKFVLE